MGIDSAMMSVKYDSYPTVQSLICAVGKDALQEALMEKWDKLPSHRGSASSTRRDAVRASLALYVDDLLECEIWEAHGKGEAVSPWDFSAVNHLPWESVLRLPAYLPQAASFAQKRDFACLLAWEMLKQNMCTSKEIRHRQMSFQQLENACDRDRVTDHLLK